MFNRLGKGLSFSFIVAVSVPAVAGVLLLEDSFSFLLEDGINKFLLEG